MLALRARIAMNQRQLAQIHGISPLQIVVADAHQQGCAAQIGHAVRRRKLQIVNECLVVSIRQKRRRSCCDCRVCGIRIIAHS